MNLCVTVHSYVLCTCVCVFVCIKSGLIHTKMLTQPRNSLSNVFGASWALSFEQFGVEDVNLIHMLWITWFPQGAWRQHCKSIPFLHELPEGLTWFRSGQFCLKFIFFQMFTAFQMLNCPMADQSLWTCNGLLNGDTEGIFLIFSFHSPVVSKTNLYYSQEIGLRKNRGRDKTPHF